MKTIRIKVNANRTMEMTNFGKLKAEDILEEIYDNERVSKIEGNVTKSIENMLYDEYKVEKITYDALVNEVELLLSDIPYDECPICGNSIGKYPAISRKDNKTRICSNCGTNEALTAFNNYFKESKEALEKLTVDKGE